MGILNKSKCYLAGNLEFESRGHAESWRAEVSDALGRMGIICMSPLDAIFVGDEPETEQWQQLLKKYLNEGNYDYVRKEMVRVRNRDLRCVDVSTFIIAYINPNLPTVGTIDEIITAKRQNKPVFLVLDGGFSKISLWLASYFKPTWVYENLDQVIDTIYDIDQEKIEINKKYWRIFKQEYL